MSDQDHQTHGTFDEDDPRTRSTVVVGALGAILVAITILLLQALHSNTAHTEEYRKEIATPYVELESVEAEQRGKLEGYRWVDQSEGIVAIPIEQAMKQVAAEGGNPR